MEEMKVVEEYKEGMQQRVRSVDTEEEHESREGKVKQEWIKLQD